MNLLLLIAKFADSLRTILDVISKALRRHRIKKQIDEVEQETKDIKGKVKEGNLDELNRKFGWNEPPSKK